MHSEGSHMPCECCTFVYVLNENKNNIKNIVIYWIQNRKDASFENLKLYVGSF